MASYSTYLKSLLLDDVEIPAKNASLNLEGDQIDITNYITAGDNGIKNYLVGLLDAGIESDGNLSSVQGYLMELKKSGSTTALTDEPMSVVTGKTYQVTDAAKRLFDPNVALVFEDNGTPVNVSNIESINYLFGRVTFTSGYSVTGPITVASGSYLPLATVAQNTGAFEIALTADVLDATTRPDAQGNGGLKVNKVGLIDSSASAERLDDLQRVYKDLLIARTPFVIESKLAGGALITRGWYTLRTVNGEGAVDGLEMENMEFAPYGPAAGEAFSYLATGSFNAGLLAALDAFFARDTVEVKYLIDSENGHAINCYVSQLTISADMSTETFNLSLVGAGALSDEP